MGTEIGGDDIGRLQFAVGDLGGDAEARNEPTQNRQVVVGPAPRLIGGPGRNHAVLAEARQRFLIRERRQGGEVIGDAFFAELGEDREFGVLVTGFKAHAHFQRVAFD